MTVGSEPKKVAILGVLVLGVFYALYNAFSGDSSAPVTVQSPAVAPPVASTLQTQAKSRRTSTGGAFEFKPRIGFAHARKTGRTPATIDPTLRLDLLAKVQNVEPEEAHRNLFQYGTPVAVAATAKRQYRFRRTCRSAIQVNNSASSSIGCASAPRSAADPGPRRR